MSGPGGVEVARISVRVVPNTKGFKSEVEKDLKEIPDGTVQIVAEVDAQKARAELDELGAQKVTVTAEVDLDQGAAQAAVAALDAEKATITANVDLDEGAAEAKLAALGAKRVTITANVDVDTGAATAKLISFKAFSGLFSGISDEVGQLSTALDGLGGPIGSAVLGIGKLAVGGFAVAEAGAGITAAWGAASTAIAAVPAAIGLIGTPIAAVLLGMDGIKKAAAAIKPQFDALQKTVSAAFEKGLTPVLQNLATNLFPQLGVGLSATASALSTVAANTANWLTSTPGVQLLSQTIGNVNQAIVDMSPGIQNITEGFLKLASNNAAMNLLSTAVNEVGAALKSISENTSLTSAFQGLEGVLTSLTRGFTGLVNNGIKLFASAAPGVQTALDGISSFFGKFDYAALGSAVGGAFRGIGEALGSIPQSTVDAITGAFQRLGAALSSPTFQSAFKIIADQIPGFVDAIGQGIDALSDLVVKAQSTFDLLGALVSGDGERIKQATLNLFKDAPPTAQERLKATGQVAKTEMGNIANEANVGGQAAHDGLINPLLTLPTDAQKPLTQTATVANAGGTATADAFTAGMQQLGAAVTQVFGPVVGAAITAGMNQLAPIVTAGFGVVTTAFTTAFSTLATGAVPLGFVGIGLAFTSGLAGIATQVTTFFGTNLSLAVGTGMLQFGNAVTLGLAGVQTAFTTGLGLIGTQVTTFFATTMSLAVGTGMLQVANAVILGMAGVSNAFTQGFANVNAAVSQAMVNVAGAFTQGFANVNAAVTAGMGNALTALNQGMANLTTAVQTGGADVVTAMTTTMTNFSKAITDGQTSAVGAIKQVVQAVVKAVDVNALVSVGAQLDQGMANGMIQNSKVVQDAARKVVQDAKAAAQAEANINSPSRLFRDQIGRPLTEGVAVGQLAEIRMVEDAARKTVQAAMAAGQSEINALGALQLGVANASSFADAVSAKVSAIVAESGASATAPVAMFSHKTVLDGKTVEESVGKVVGEWAKDVNTLVKVA